MFISEMNQVDLKNKKYIYIYNIFLLYSEPARNQERFINIYSLKAWAIRFLPLNNFSIWTDSSALWWNWIQDFYFIVVTIIIGHIAFRKRRTYVVSVRRGFSSV